MKILIFHPWIKSKGGAERLVYEYTKRSKHKINILTWYHNKNLHFSKGLKITYYFNNPLFEKISRSYFLRLTFLPFGSFSENFDLFLVSTSGIAELVLLKNTFDCPVVAYVHTPLRATYFWDIKWSLKYRFKNWFVKEFYKFALHIYNKLEKKAWKKIDFAIFNSYLSRKRALDKGLIEEERTKVIYPGVDLENLYYDEPEDYFLYIARFGMAKRQDILIKSFAKFSKKFKDYKLILAGGLENKKYFTYLLKLIKKYKLQDKVKLLYNLPYKKIVELYARSLAFVHVPFMEDFGIAPLEAAAAGKYIINVYPAGNYEILKDFPGVYWIKEKFYDEKMVEEVYKALEYFVKNQDELIEKGKENRKLIKKLDLSWDRFAKEMDKTLEEVYKDIHY